MIHRHIHKALKHTFIPHEGNDHRPYFLREHVVLSITILSILTLLLSASSYLVIRKTVYGTLVASSVLVDFTNDTRKEYNLPPLIKNKQLERSSLLKAEEMDHFKYFSHTSPDGNPPWKFFHQALYEYAFAGENLALNFTSSRGVHNGWLNSPKHKENVINPRYKEIGISVLSTTFNERPVLFVVQHFGLPHGVPEGESGPYSSFAERILFYGSSYVEMLYYALIALIVIALLGVLSIEIQKHHRKHILYGVLMFVLVLLCILINKQLLQ